MKLIPLGGKHGVNKHAIVDDEDYEKLSKLNWRAILHHGNYYAVRTCRINGRKKLSMHRVVLNVTNKKMLVDHINRNGLDNQKCNLRICNNSENCKNKKSKTGSTSKYLGVHLSTEKKTYLTKRGIVTNLNTRYRAKIKTPQKEYSLGTFPNTSEGEILAAKAYDKAAKIYHGEFANLNFKD